jgi:choline dehydrogenase-like flavoprotein
MTAADPASVDVVIVGSGPSGAAYARVITSALPNADVLMVDAGPIVSAPPGAHVNTIVEHDRREAAKLASQGPTPYPYDADGYSSVEEWDLAASRNGAVLAHKGLFLLSAAQDTAIGGFPALSASDNVGGMGAHWFGCCPRPWGQERIDFLDDGVLDRALSEAETMLKVGTGQFADSKAAALRETLLGEMFDAGREQHRRVQPIPLAIDSGTPGTGQAGSSVILEPVTPGSAPGFELRPNTLCRTVIMKDGRAEGVELINLADGSVSEVRARYVVVAADSFRTPQLLFASGVRPPALGRYLNEHPYVSMRIELPETSPLAGLDADLVSAADGEEIIPPSGITWVPYGGDEFPLQAGITQWAGDILAINLMLPQSLESTNRVEFDDSTTDWRGLPAMHVRYQLSDHDHTIVTRAHDMLRSILDKFGVPVPTDLPQPMPAGTSLHYQGTVRMGAHDDATSVCDRNSVVWGTENLVVAGNGVIPTSTACNPTLTSVALAVLGAEEIVRQLTSGSGADA